MANAGPLTTSTASTGTTLRACKSCKAPTAFDPASGGLKCPYCGAQSEIARGEVARHPLEEMTALAPAADEGARVLQCTQCHAQTTVASNVAATKCAFCTAPLAPSTNAALPPAEGVIPFTVTNEAAANHFSQWLSGLWFRPSNLKRLGRLREIRGMYVPNWTFDTEAYSEWSADAGYYYDVVVTETVNGEQRQVTKREIRWEPAAGDHRESYIDLLESASAGLAPKELTGIEPFDLEGKLTTFDDDYLAGFEAESPGISAGDCWTRAAERVQAMERTACDRMVPGDTHRSLNVTTSTANELVCSLLLPVYIAAYEYSGQVYRVVVNGQSGKVAGTAPWSVWKIVSLTLAVLIAVIAVVVYFQSHRH